MKKSTKQKTITAVVTSVLLTGVIASAAVLGGCAGKQNSPSAAANASTAAVAATEATAAPATAAPATAAPAQQGGSEVTLEKAISIAVADAGFSQSEVQITKQKLDTDDGVQKYEIEFVKDGYEYEYDINPKTGAVIEKSKDLVND